MEASLARFLESVDISQLEDRDQLLLSAKGGWIDAEGAVRIGSWVLASERDPLVLRIRMPSSVSAPVSKAYIAALAHVAGRLYQFRTHQAPLGNR